MFDSITPVIGPFGGRQDRLPRGTVLLVEDHIDSREILAVLFTSLGYKVLEADKGDEALQLAANNDVDLIVTDLGLPVRGGVELVQLVRALKNDQPNLRIAMLTAYHREDCISAALEAGCDLVLSKPIDSDKLERLVSLLPEDSGSALTGQLTHAHNEAAKKPQLFAR